MKEMSQPRLGSQVREFVLYSVVYGTHTSGYFIYQEFILLLKKRAYSTYLNQLV